MATITSVQNGAWAIGSTWDLGRAPLITDEVVLAGHTVTVSSSATCNGLSATSASSLVLGANLNCENTLALSDVSLLNIGGSTVFITGTNLLVDVGTSGGIALLSDLTIDGDFELAGGTINTNSYDLTVNNGTSIYTAGTLTTLNLVTTGTCSLSWNAGSGKRPYVTVASGSLDFIFASYLLRLTTLPGTTLTGAVSVLMRPIDAGNYLDIQGTDYRTGLMIVSPQASSTNTGRIVFSSTCQLQVLSSVDSSAHTLSGELNVPSLLITGSSGSLTSSVIIAGNMVSLGSVTLGTAGTDRHGTLELRKTVKISSLKLAISANAGSRLSLNSCFLELSGEFTGTGITVTADEGMHIVNPIGGSGRLTNVAPDNVIHAHDCTVDGDCSNVSDNTEAYPGSLLMCGAGN